MPEALTIDHVGHRGDGVALAPGRTVYVPFTLPGEQVRVEPDPQHAERCRLIAVERPSPERIAPFCPHFGACGGCRIQHWQLPAYLRWKRQMVVDTLGQAGVRSAVGDIIDAHGNGRRRIVAHARRGAGTALEVGFSAAGSHDVVPIDRCPILVPALAGAFDAARALASALGSTGKPLDIQVTATRNGLDIDIRGSGPLAAAALAALSQLAARHSVARLTRHGELVVMHRPPVIGIGTADVTLPPGSFLQATEAGEAALAALVVGYCERARRVADLFCGVGPFSLRLAQRARVLAVDSDAVAVAALQKAASITAGLKPVTAEARDLFRRPMLPSELRDIDAVVFDPPRQGAQAQATELAASRVPLVVAVSCNPASFARDAAILIAGGYRCDEVTPVDQFRHSAHVELVACFRRA